MSLINDMLKNLERRYETAQKSWATPESTDLQEEESIFLKACLITIIVLILVFLAWEVHHFYFKKPEKSSTADVTTIKPDASIRKQAPIEQNSAAPANSSLPLPPQVANDITINDLPNQTEISIALNNTPTYFTSVNQNQHSVDLTIKNTYLDMDKICAQLSDTKNCANNTDIPLTFSGTAVQKIHIVKNDGQSLILHFVLTPQAKLNTSQLSIDPPSLKLIFDKDASNSSPSIQAPLPIQPTSTAAAAPMTATVAQPPNSISPQIAPSNSDTSSNSGISPANLINNGPSDDGITLVPTKAQLMVEEKKQPFATIDNLLMQNQFEQAKAAWQKLPNQYKTSIEGVMEQAKIYIGTGDNASALKTLQSVSFDSQSAEYYALYAAVLEFNNQHTAAVAVYQKLVSFWPDNPDWWLGLGISAFNNGQDALAASAFHRVLAFNDLNPEVQQFAQKKIEELSMEQRA
ncbi:MAG: repeat-containing protein [Gammaproteobacteria bacterium]|jgi:hypothetical protein|nr:repeat-containing protein [Gammaproteobacteria bacterium]